MWGWGSGREQEAARQDPDCSEYGVLMRQYKRMESTKEAGNQAFKTNKLQVKECMQGWF